mgnify:CR=1 FL=1
MPYRRLPNTDQARVRALKAAVEKGDVYNVRDLAISLKTLFEARNFLLKFELRRFTIPNVMTTSREPVASIRRMCGWHGCIYPILFKCSTSRCFAMKSNRCIKNFMIFRKRMWYRIY